MTLIQDLRFALRGLRAHAGTSLFAVLTLACGMAAAIAITGVIDAVLLRALPYPQPERLVQIREVADDGRTMALAAPNYQDLADSVDAFATSAFHYAAPSTIVAGTATSRGTVDVSGGEFFRTLGVAPLLGRTFNAGEHEPVAVVAYSLWQGLLHARDDVLGQPLELDGQHYTIIGVMPARFAFPEHTLAWTPLLDDAGTSRTAHNFQAVGRLRTDADLVHARIAANGLASRLKAQLGKDTDAVGFDLVPLADAIAAPVRNALLLLAAGTAFLLLIAITNTTNLLLALAAARSRELAVRSALGASAWRIARQILLESLLIAFIATVVALVAATMAIRVLVRMAGDSIPRANEIEVGADLVATSIVIAVAIALVIAGAVLWSNRHHNPIGELRESGRGQSPSRRHLRARAVLLIGQTSLTTVLLIGAGLLGRSFVALLDVDPGFEPEGAVSVQLAQPRTRDASVGAATARRYQELIDAFVRTPGVEAVGGVSSLPLTQDGANGGFWDASVTNFDRAPPPPIGDAEFRVASDGYFKAAGIPLISGRTFAESDRADGEHVAIVSAATARATWGTGDPLGQRIQFGNMDGDTRVLTVVGVVGDVHQHGLERAAGGSVYVDLAQRPMAASEFNIVVRSTLPVTSLANTLRAILEQRASDVPHSVRPLADVRASALADRRFSLILLGAFAVVAFVLATGGLYGLMAFAVGQRGHEFALRQALGASRGGIARLVLGNGLRIGLAGIALGVGLALSGARVMGALLYGVSASDPLTLSGVSALLLVTLMLACVLPVRRACAFEPRDALA